MAFVVTAGQIQAVQRAPGTYFSVGATPAYVQLSPTLALTYEQMWRAQPALRTVVGFLARNVAQLGVDAYERVSATDRVKLIDHPVARLLERPVPGTKWTKYRLVNTLMHDLCVFDAAFLLKLRLDGAVHGILPVPPRLIQPAGDNWFEADEYTLTGNQANMSVKAENLVHIHGWNPDDPRKGVSPIETLRQILAEEYSASRYREQMWRNGARTAGYISRPKDAPRWSAGARDNFKADWQAQYTGDGPATGGTPILEDGMTFNGSGVTPRDAQYVESRKLTREEVAVAYHVPPVMLGLMEGANFSSITEMHRMLYQDTLAPYLAQISQDLECQLLEDVDASAKSGRVYIEFNLQEKLRGSFEQQAAAISSSVGAPWMTRGEARALFNLPHIDGDEELITPLNVVTGGLASPRDTAPDNPDNGPSNGQPPKAATVRAAAFVRQRNAVLSRLDKPTAADAYDTTRWTVELADDLTALGVEDALTVAAADTARTYAALCAAWDATDRKAAVRGVFEESA